MQKALRLLLLAVLLGCAQTGNAQGTQVHGTGCLKETPEQLARLEPFNLEKLKRLSPLGADAVRNLQKGTATSRVLPAPPIMDQGGQNSCVGHSLSCMMSTMLLETMPAGTAYTDNIVRSTQYIWVQYNGGGNGGMGISQAISESGTGGDCSRAVMPYSGNDYTTQPTSYQRTQASYTKVTPGVMSVANAAQVKSAVDLGYPVMISLQMDESVNGVWTTRITFDNAWKVTSYYPHGWNHAVTIVGYDDATSCFKVQNSWGSGWGANGFFYIPYASIDGGMCNTMQLAYGIASANSECPNPLGTGLTAQIYTNSTGTMPTGTPTLTRTDATVDFNWGNNSPATGISADNFMIRWQGQVEAPYSGNYTFSVTGDDGYNLWINGAQVISKWVDQGSTKTSASPITLNACQKYDIRLEYYEKTGGANCQLQWTPPVGSEAVIPSARLYPPVACATNIALSKTATASGVEAAGPSYTADKAFDGTVSTASRWSSGQSDASWLTVDLGTSYDICKVVLKWEAAYGANYNIQVSDDNTTWTTVQTVTGNTTTTPPAYSFSSASGRYVRMQGVSRRSGYQNYSLYEMEVYGSVKQLIGNGLYLVSGKQSGLYWDMYGASTSDNQQVAIWSLNFPTTTNQQYTVTHLGNNTYKIVNVNSAKAIGAQAGGTTDGTAVVQYTDNSAAYQKWEAISAGGGFYYLKNVNSGKTMQVSNAGTAVGSLLVCNTPNTGDNGKWKFVIPTSIESAPAVATGDRVQVYPNPAADELMIAFTAAAPGDAVLTLSDVSGRVVYNQSARAEAGSNHMRIDVRGIAPGVYMLALRCGPVQPSMARIVIQR